MKKLKWIVPASMILFACNNNDTAKDSMEKADSANMAKIDSTQNNMSNPQIQADEESASFLVMAANGGMAEVQLGQLTQQKATAQAVKDFGAMMVSDHSAANSKVKALAMQRNVTLPDTLSGDPYKVKMDLEKKSGADYDKAYVKAMVKDHEEDIEEFKKASDKVKDTEVKAFIDNTIPTLQKHLDAIKNIQKSMK